MAGMLRGDPGSAVRLDVKRGGSSFAFPLTRAQFKVIVLFLFDLHEADVYVMDPRQGWLMGS